MRMIACEFNKYINFKIENCKLYVKMNNYKTIRYIERNNQKCNI